MALFCPKPCGRLATAAVFIAVGVIQLLVGVILLRSKYADLLSGADFLTSATNILIGCLYGVAASVWQDNTKSIPEKRTARKNTLAALLVTVITVNTTAVIVLLMSDGNKLLSLPYFNDHSGHSSVTFAKEVFASAYVTSVCSPIVCLVVALVALSGNCLQMYRTQNNPNNKSSDEKTENHFGWVYEEKSQPGSKVNSDKVRTSSESSISENSVFSFNSDSSSFKRKSSLSLKNIASPLHTWRQKRARILRNDSLARKGAPFDASFQNANFSDGSHKGLIPRIKDSSKVQISMKNVRIKDDASKLGGVCRSSKENQKSNTGIYHSSNGNDYKKVRSDSYVNAILEENRVHYETNLKRKCASMVNKGVDTGNLEQKYCRSKSPEHFRSAHPSVSETLVKSRYGNSYNNPLGNSDVYVGEVNEVEDPEITRLKLQTLQELKKRVKRTGSKDPKICFRRNDNLEEQHKEKTYFKSSIHGQSPRDSTEGSSHSKENFSPGEVFEPRTNSNVANGYPHHRKDLSSLPANLRSYSPKPLDLRTGEKIHTEMKEIRAVGSNANNYSSSAIVTKNQSQASEGEVYSYDERNIGKTEQDYPNITSSKLPTKKREMSRKVGSMASIAEIPSEEGVGLDYSSTDPYSKRTASLDEGSRDVDENSNITIHSSLTRAFSENPNFKKPRSFSPKGILKKMWSSASPESKFSVSDLIVDEDSLIGLSDEELLNRTLRIRSLRKVVADRLKKENEIKNKMNPAYAAN